MALSELCGDLVISLKINTQLKYTHKQILVSSWKAKALEPGLLVLQIVLSEAWQDLTPIGVGGRVSDQQKGGEIHLILTWLVDVMKERELMICKPMAWLPSPIRNKQCWVSIYTLSLLLRNSDGKVIVLNAVMTQTSYSSNTSHGKYLSSLCLSLNNGQGNS